MTCASCELLLERELMKLEGVTKVKVNHRTKLANIRYEGDMPSIDTIRRIVSKTGYRLSDDETNTVSDTQDTKWRDITASLIIFFVIVFLLRAFNISSLAPSTNAALSLGSIFLIGLVAGASTCMAVSGGLLVALAAKYHERNPSQSSWERFQPLWQFNVGRISSYFVFGGIVGVLGQSISFSAQVTAILNIIIALVMISLALSILKIFPSRLSLRLPRKLTHGIASISESDHPLAPFSLGALTFFLPCGFTQSLQLVALASGSFFSGALIMATFALGTLPSLIGISAISASAKGRFSSLFLRFSGTVVLVLALFNLSSGLAAAGFDTGNILPASPPAGEAPVVHNDVQEVNMAVTEYGYLPNVITIKAGVPVRWIVDGTQATGCTGGIMIPSLNISRFLKSGPNVIEFTAPSPGRLPFSCTMGMVRGEFNVI